MKETSHHFLKYQLEYRKNRLYNQKSISLKNEEQELLSSLNHNHIVKQIKVSNQLLVNGIYGKRIIKNYMNENHNLNKEQRILLGLTYLHQHNVIHRVINLIISYQPKTIYQRQLIWSKYIQFETLTILLVNVIFIFIWLLKSYKVNSILKPHQYLYKLAVETGIIMYQLLQGVHTFYNKQDSTKQKYLQNILEKPLHFKKHISQYAKDLLIRLLKIDISDHYTANQTLQHPLPTQQHSLLLSLFEQFKHLECQIVDFLFNNQKYQNSFLDIFQVNKIFIQNRQNILLDKYNVSSKKNLMKITFAQLSPQKPKRSTMNFFQAPSKHAEIMFGYSAIKVKRKPTEIKLELLDRRTKSTSCVEVLSYKQ